MALKDGKDERGSGSRTLSKQLRFLSRFSRSAAPSPPSPPPQRSVSRRSPYREKAEPRLLLELKDLDRQRHNFTLEAKPGVLVSKLDSVIRLRGRDPVPDDALVLLYREGRELPPGSALHGGGTVFYRVMTGYEDSSLQIRLHQGGNDSPLDSVAVRRLTEAIDAGISLGELRARLGEQLKVADASRIVVRAWGGMRPGPLEGDCWEVRQVRAWLCRTLIVEVYPGLRYLRVVGLDRTYIYHPASPGEPHAVVRPVKLWIHSRIAKGVHQRACSGLSVRARQIQLSCDGKILEGFSRIPWGSDIEFDLPRDAAEAFSDEETWLLPASETCSVCCDDKRASEIPRRVTTKCVHRPSLCKQCLQKWIESSLEDTAWDRLRCPECPELLAFEDVKRYASGSVFKRYDVLATRAAILREFPNFRWCLGAKCDSGQIHNDSCPKFRCHVCHAKHCVAHNVPWHTGETCEEYDQRNRRRRREEKKSEKAVKDMSKQCPECKKDVHKYTGCNHITCICGHEWCYLCFAPYRTTPEGFLRCQHNAGCDERDIFADLGFIPGAGPLPPRPGVRPRAPRGPFRLGLGIPGGGPGAWPRNRAAVPVPPVVPVPPLFAEPPLRVREEMENVRRRANVFVGDFADLAAAAAVAAANAVQRRARDVVE